MPSAVRLAQALGLHRDPGWKKWEEMQPIDRELRITSWWLLMVSDRYALKPSACDRSLTALRQNVVFRAR